MKKQREQVQYVFLDVANFTTNRSVEDMLAIIDDLNGIVIEQLEELSLVRGGENLILIPTGDGMCIALLNQGAVDTHLKLAIMIRAAVSARNTNTESESRRFELHLAVHEGKDIIIKDINDGRNIIGAAINNAARLMERCEAGDLLVSEVVHDGVHLDEEYIGKFQALTLPDKKGIMASCYRMGHKGPDEFRAMLLALDQLSGKVGPLLRLEDIVDLNVNDSIWHKHYGRGVVESIAIYTPRSRGRKVAIRFKSHLHQVLLTNEKGNYHRWLA